MGLLLLCGGVVQWLLGDLKFSTIKAEWVFRLLFMAPTAVDAAMTCRAATLGWRAVIGVFPVASVMFTLLWLRHQTDAQGALFVFMLPFIHGLLTLLMRLLGRWVDRAPR